MLGDFNQYSTAKPLVQGASSWIADEMEALRIASYQLYEQIYWNVPETFKLVQRGADHEPIYIPAAKTIVETLHRFLGKGMTIVSDPTRGDSTSQLLLQQVWDDLSARERFFSRFTANKRYGIIRGDWLWHFYADPLKPPGSRVSIFPVDPASWFPIFNEDNLDELIGINIVDPFLTEEGKQMIRRLTYRKATGQGGPSPITMEIAIFKPDDWGGPGMEQDPSPEEIISPLVTLPSPIDSIPIYAMSNFEEPGSPYGSSELRGFERILAGIDQGISDEELALAMDGLGVYATNAGAPIDPDTGAEMPWNLGPARVVEVPTDSFFNRVSGITSVDPVQAHLKYLHDQVNEASGSPSVARGIVDATVAESGIALEIEFGPLTARAEEKLLGITGILGNMFYDLPKWLVAYEGSAFSPLLADPVDPAKAPRLIPIFGDLIPTNKSKEVEHTIAMAGAGLISGQTARDKLRELGYSIPEETEEQIRILGEKERTAKIEADALGSRIDGELANAGVPPDQANVAG